MTTHIAVTSSLFLGLAMLLLPSAQAMSPPPLHQSDGMSTEARYVGRGWPWPPLRRCPWLRA